MGQYRLMWGHKSNPCDLAVEPSRCVKIGSLRGMIVVKIRRTGMDDVLIIEPKVFGDHRGWFTETYSRKTLEELGLKVDFVQDNHSFSASKGTLRGLHFQLDPKAQTKLVRCTSGRILDVAVDLRKGSPTYKEWVAVELSSDNKRQLLIPKDLLMVFLR